MTWLHLALLILLAIGLTYPCLTHGLPDGHDRDPHILYQHLFDEQVSSGDFYPRWMPGLNRGLGGGIFFMQYPLPYYVAWGIGKIIPNRWGIYTETHTQGLALVLATILAALFTYAWCATFTDRLSAAIGAAVYVTLPYFFTIDLYLRTSVGEFWALSLLPLSFFFVERMRTAPERSRLGLAVAFALVILSHLFTAVLLAPALLLYVVCRAEPRHRISGAAMTLVALALAGGLAGVYTLPALVHKRFLHPENFIAAYRGNYSPLSQMFPYNPSVFPRSGHGWRPLGDAAVVLDVGLIAFIAARVYLSRKQRPALFHLSLAVLSSLMLCVTALAIHFHISGIVSGALPLTPRLSEQRGEIFLCSFLTLEAALLCYWSVSNAEERGPENFLVVLALASYFMMTSGSQILWKTIHFLWNVQFPWRFNVLLTIATAGLAAMAISRFRSIRPRRCVLSAFLALVVWGLVAAGTAALGPARHTFANPETVASHPAVDGALPVYAQVNPRAALNVQPPEDGKIQVTVVDGSGRAEISPVGPRKLEIKADCSSACTLQISQFYYPAWKARLLGATMASSPLDLRADPPGGLMEVTLPAGHNDAEIELPRGWSERAGLWLSAVCLILIIVLAIAERLRTDKKKQISTHAAHA